MPTKKRFKYKMIITRFAPSPTGSMHIGSLRTALFSWVHAKQNNGIFLLRIDDTDKDRSSSTNIKHIFEGLNWMGIQSDRDPYYQSHNFDYYNIFINKLLEENSAYKCYCSTNRLNQLRFDQVSKGKKPKYDGCCRNKVITSDLPSTNFVVRFKNPSSGQVLWNDLVKGQMIFNNDELDDLIIKRSDGSPTYNFCCVLDDIRMKITHIIRGDDHISNTPRQINLYRSLNSKPPSFAHLPMILDKKGKKMSKRRENLDIIHYRNEGYLPESLVNCLMRLGWSYGNQELFNMQDILNTFDVKKVRSSPAIFDSEKLDWISHFHMNSLPFNKLKKKLLQYARDFNINYVYADNDSLTSVMSKRSKNFKDFFSNIACLYRKPQAFDISFLEIHGSEKVLLILENLSYLLKSISLESWQDDKLLKDTIFSLSEQLLVKKSTIGGTLRIALTGSKSSPDIALVLKTIGKKEVVSRIKAATTKVKHIVLES